MPVIIHVNQHNWHNYTRTLSAEATNQPIVRLLINQYFWWIIVETIFDESKFQWHCSMTYHLCSLLNFLGSFSFYLLIPLFLPYLWTLYPTFRVFTFHYISDTLVKRGQVNKNVRVSSQFVWYPLFQHSTFGAVNLIPSLVSLSSKCSWSWVFFIELVRASGLFEPRFRFIWAQ